MATAAKNDGFFSGLNVADVFNGYVKLESEKVRAGMGATAKMQKDGLNATSVAQNPQATAAPVTSFLGGLSGKKIGLGVAGLGVLLAALKIAKVI